MLLAPGGLDHHYSSGLLEDAVEPLYAIGVDGVLPKFGNKLLDSPGVLWLRSDRQAGFAHLGLVFGLALLCSFVMWITYQMHLAEWKIFPNFKKIDLYRPSI